MSLWWCYIRSCWKLFALGGLYKLMGDCVGFVGPLGISVVISYVTTLREPDTIQTEYPTLSEFLNNGYVMGTIVFLAALAQGTFSQSSTHLVSVEGIHLKGALQVLSLICAYMWVTGYFNMMHYENSCCSDKVEEVVPACKHHTMKAHRGGDQAVHILNIATR